MADRLTRVGALVRLNTILMLREPGPIVSRLVMPVAMMLLLRPLYVAAAGRSGDGTADAVIGMAVMFSLLALALVGSAILRERAWNTWDRLNAGGARPLEMFAGKAVPAFAFLVLQQAVVLAVGVLGLGLQVRATGLLIAALLVWVTTLLCLGTALGTFARTFSELSAVQDVGGLLLTGLGGALVPLAMLPAWLCRLAMLSPGYWGVESMRRALAGNVGGVLRAGIVLAAFAAGALAAAAWRMRRDSRRAQVM